MSLCVCIFSRAIAGPRPMDLYIKAFPFRLFMTLVFGVIVWWTSFTSNGEYSMVYYVVLVTAFLLHQVMAPLVVCQSTHTPNLFYLMLGSYLLYVCGSNVLPCSS